ncbi:MAG TPA: helix-turn-helix transcriptional regulator [Croceibacterium sp.]|nr:helix-turn-helix transcriptional regulator [Croceibacterium sp.]
MTRGRAKLAMGEGLAAWVLEAPDGFGDAGFHTHHAIQLTVSFSGRLALISGEERIVGPLIAVGTDTLHRFEADGLLGFIFVEPESHAGRALTETVLRNRPLAEIDDAAFAEAAEPLRQAFEPGLTAAAMLAIAGCAVAALAGESAPTLPDSRIRRIIDHAMARPELSLDEAAAGAGVYLSESRLRHLFVEHTGLAFKTYMLWQRLIRALETYSEGRSLTESAHEAGFSDSAHFSRVFKRYFGLPATTLTRV